ncbi:LysR family transcriptional regulator [Vibrio cyclitrophicus]|uniref:LysR family transcriptional regulator n=1 Tax=Vibrio cyclitrophicus TaxID=47951 RepID=UPI00031955D0|nr:LysR family transcriptional regulator [Vibrio cyclitrophicus]OED70554.1 LysR family transcriptional regulator [Vibrio cyclitrophicus ZF99]PME13417.1 LysR family transcriptional regulator [Vibrio cyclitrophicus]PME74508.1 LysR family transcriptional regulator [Vibrio cyclitrophicus]PMK18778.1 LysR family transcriptional regulator [Vibrio cyclitrophicus]
MSDVEKLDLNLLNVFLEVYRLKSITLASESLGMTQPGVSGALKRLQSQLGTDLFIREGRGISPTNAATQLALRIEPALDGISSAVSSLQQFDNQQHHVFRILVNEIGLTKLQPLVEKDNTLGNISIEFNMVPNNEEDLLQSLSMQQADLAIDIHYPQVNGYMNQQVIEDRLVLIARHGHPRIDGSVTEAQYYDEKHVTFRMRRSRLYTADYFTKQAIKPRKVSSECDSLMMMCVLVSGSDCVGSTSRDFANQFAERFQLQVLEQPFEVLPMQQYMIWHKRTESNLAHQWLRNKIQQYMAD